MNIRCLLDRTLRASRAGVTWSAGLAALALFVAFSAPAFAAVPVLNGNIDDVVALANTYIANGTGCGIVINDPSKDVCLTDPLIIPCTSTFTTCTLGAPYYVNGYDQTLATAAVQGTDGWWGIRTAGGQIGDADGDGTDTKGGSCPPPGGGNPVSDVEGIGPGESYVIQLDTNCDNITDVRITVTGGAGTHQPTVIITNGAGTPIGGASGTAQYGTTDLEIHTSGLVLPPIFKMSTFVGSESDGLSEDAAGPVLCNVPVVSLTIQKTVDKPVICAGDKARFTVSVHNTSVVDVSANVRDILPQGWTYADNVSGDFAFNSQAGQVVSFGPLTIPAGATRTVSFDATSPSDCLGPYENKAVADAAFSSPCLPPPGVETALTDTARATVTCSSKPCVTNVHCTAPANACDGDQITVKGFATNCGDRAADIVITLNGHDHIINNVGAGAEAEFDTTFTFNCTPGQPTQWSISAVAKNSCGTSTPGTSTCSTNCATPPCATVTCDAQPTSASSGTPIVISAIGHNCGDRNEDLLVCVLRNGVQVGCHWLRNVPPNTDARWDTTVTFECTGDEIVNYSANISGVNDCGQSNTASSPTTCPVQCLQFGGSCPRTVGYWAAQCAQKGNGSTKFTLAEVTAIASCIDSRVDIFSWSDDFAGFCGVITPDKPMNCKKQALRQFAGLLANACVGQLGYKASNGDSVFLNLSDPNPCKSAFPNAATLGDLIDAIDDALVALQNANADPQDPGYCAIVECADGINNGRGIPIAPGCGEETSAPSRLGGNGELQVDASGLDVNGLNGTQVLELYRPTPNPFSNTTNFAYQVTGSASQRVQIGIYNVAGRLIRELVNETKAPGQYQTVWNGQDMGGASVVHGVYFIRAYVGGIRVSDASRILYLR